MKHTKYTDVYGEVPKAFSDRMEQVLSRLEEEKEVKRFVVRPVFIAAILLLVIGTALAVGVSSIRDGFSKVHDIVIDESAEPEIKHDMGSYTYNGAVVTLREAAFDGKSVLMFIEISSVDDTQVIKMEGLDGVCNEINGKSVDEYCSESGKSVLKVGSLDILAAGYDVPSGSYIYDRNGENVVVYADMMIENCDEDEIRIGAALVDPKTGVKYAETFPIKRAETDTYVYEVTGYGVDGIDITSVTLERSPFADYLTVEYSAEKAIKAAVGQVYTDDAVYWFTAAGRYAHAEEHCGGMKGANAHNALETIEAYKIPCPMCLGNKLPVAIPVPALYDYELYEGQEMLLKSEGGCVYFGGTDIPVRGLFMGPREGYITIMLPVNSIPAGELTLKHVPKTGEQRGVYSIK